MTGKAKTIAAASTAAAVAATGAMAYVLAKRAPKRAAFRAATGWTSARAYARSPKPEPRKSMPTSPATASPQSASQSKPIESADPKPKPGLIGAIKEVYYEFSNDDVMTQAAALAFYSGLAFAPLLTLVVWVMRVFAGEGNKDNIADLIGKVLGPATAGPMKDLLANTGEKGGSGMTVAGIVSIALVAFSASGVFGQLQSALNAVWHVQGKPTNGLIGFIRKRLLSMGMLASILFLLMTSLIVSSTLTIFVGMVGSSLGGVIGLIVEPIVSLGLFTVLFAAMFRFVPDAKIDWKPVWIGSAISALLFTIGKYGLSIYLGKSDYGSSYGAAAGSFVALLVWVYYSAVILLVGAEATEVTARRLGHGLTPDEHAVRVVTKEEPA